MRKSWYKLRTPLVGESQQPAHAAATLHFQGPSVAWPVCGSARFAATTLNGPRSARGSRLLLEILRGLEDGVGILNRAAPRAAVAAAIAAQTDRTDAPCGSAAAPATSSGPSTPRAPAAPRRETPPGKRPPPRPAPP